MILLHDPRLDQNKMVDTEAFLGLISTDKRTNTKMKPLNIGLELNNWYIRIVSGELISLIASIYHTVCDSFDYSSPAIELFLKYFANFLSFSLIVWCTAKQAFISVFFSKFSPIIVHYSLR